MEMQQHEAESSSSSVWSVCTRKVPTKFRSRPAEKNTTNSGYRLFPTVEPTPPTSPTLIVSSEACHSLIIPWNPNGHDKLQSTSMNSGTCQPQSAKNTTLVKKELCYNRMTNCLTSAKCLQEPGSFLTPSQTVERGRLPISSSMRPSTAQGELPNSDNPVVLDSGPRVDAADAHDARKASIQMYVASDEGSTPTQSLAQTLKDLTEQKQTLREEYLSLRAERTRLLDSINLALRQTNPRTTHAIALSDRVLSLSMLAISMDVCFYRMKATYFRQDAAVAQLVSRINLGEVGIVDRRDETQLHLPYDEVYEVTK